jgi:hypothetical protein
MAEAVVAEHGLIGDLRMTAQVGTDGSIDPPAPPLADQPAPALGAVPVPAGSPAQASR